MDTMTEDDMLEKLNEAYGEAETDRLIICEFGSIACLYKHAEDISLFG